MVSLNLRVIMYALLAIQDVCYKKNYLSFIICYKKQASWYEI